MSLRDFNTPSDDPIALHNNPQGNGTGLGNFHTINPQDREPNNTPKIVGALVVALMVGVAGIGLYAYSGSASNRQTVIASNTPASSMPAPPPAPLPASEPSAVPPEQVAQADHAARAAVRDPNDMRAAKAKTFPAGSPSAAAEPIAPMKSASAKPLRSSGTETAAPAETSLANPTPQQQAAAPAPSRNDVASINPNQPITATPPATASDVPAAPAAAAPAQDPQTGATPPPAQSAGQVNQ